MPFSAQVLRVLIASPGDTVEARQVVEREVTHWNRSRSRDTHVILMPLWWRVDAVPRMGGDGQSVVNRQLVDQADIVVALFHSRLGAPTPRAASGTAEEIDRAVDRGVPVHVYFAEMPYPYGVDLVDVERMRKFRLRVQRRGLLGTYASHDELAEKVRTALEHDVADFASASNSNDFGTREQPLPSRDSAPVGGHGAGHRLEHRDHPMSSGGPGSVQQNLGRNLRAYRRAEGVSQEAFARAIGVHRTYLGALERGGRNISLASVERLAARVGVTPYELVRYRPDEHP